MLFSFQQINYHENKRSASFVLNLKYLSQNLVKLYMYTAMSEWLCLKDVLVPAISQSLQQDVLCVFSMKTWSKETPHYSFRFYSSRGFRNTPYMLNLLKFWLRFSRLKISLKISQTKLYHIKLVGVFWNPYDEQILKLSLGV